MRASYLEVQRRQCDTCIYTGDALDVRELERQVADPMMDGFFLKYRACHHASNRRSVCCRGFWDRHKDHFTLGQLAQRLGLVVFVHVDRFARRRKK